MDAVIDSPVGDRCIHGSGTHERAWQAWSGLTALHTIAPLSWITPQRRTVVVAPHPDDEVLGCGGLLAMLAAAGREVMVVAVTDGEASHPDSPQWTPLRLAQTRRRESAEGWRRLGMTRIAHRRLGFRDGDVGTDRARLERVLVGLLRPSDAVFCTWRYDGHPDHEATGKASAVACARVGCELVEMPVWAWHWSQPGDSRVPWQHLHRVTIDEATLRRKRAAIAAHRSQLEPDANGRAPVLPYWALDRLLRHHEYFFIHG